MECHSNAKKESKSGNINSHRCIFRQFNVMIFDRFSLFTLSLSKGLLRLPKSISAVHLRNHCIVIKRRRGSGRPFKRMPVPWITTCCIMKFLALNNTYNQLENLQPNCKSNDTYTDERCKKKQLPTG